MRIRLALVAITLSFQWQFSFAQELLSQNKPNRLFSSGKLLLKHAELGAAEKQFQDFLRTAPNIDNRIPEAAYYRSFCAMELYHADAEKYIDDFLTNNPEDTWLPVMYYDAAHFFYKQKKYKKAISYFEKIDFSTLDEVFYIPGRFYWGYSLFNLKKLDNALEQFNYIKFLDNRFGPVSSYYAGFIELISGDYDHALEDLKGAEKSESYADIVPYLIAGTYYKKKDFNTLAKYLKGLEGKNFTNKEEMGLFSAELAFKQKRYKKALEGYQHYLNSQEKTASKPLLLKAGFTAYLTDQDSVAISYLTKSVTAPDSVGFYSSYYLGALYLKKGYKLLALNAFSQSEKYTTNPYLREESTYQKAKILYDMGRFDEAVSKLEKFVLEYPSSRHAFEGKALLSKAYVNVLNYDRAMNYIASLSVRTPVLNKVYQKAAWLKGAELFNKEDYIHAVQFFEKSLQYPMDKACVAEVSFWNGEAYSIGKKYKSAIVNYLRVTNLPNYADRQLLTKTRYALGYAFFSLKQYTKALYNFEEFIKNGENNANYFDGMLRLADCYYVTKSYTNALSTYQKYTQLGKTEQDYALLQIGIILSIQQQYDQALATLDRAIKEYPTSQIIDEALFQKTQINFEQGNYAVAVEGYTKLITEHPTSRFIPYAYMRRAASYYNLKEYEKTVSDYSKVLKKYPLHPVSKDALLPLQEALNLAGHAAKFESYLTQYKQDNPNKKDVEIIEFETTQRFYFNQKYRQTIKSFENYIANYPHSPRLTKARYYQAESYYRLGEHEKAMKLYEHIVTDTTFAPINKVVTRIAELAYKMKNYRKAITDFNRLAGIANSKKEKVKAWLGMMESYFMIAVYDSSDIYANHILEEGGVNIGARNKASLFLGKSALKEKKYEIAQDEFISTINIAQDESGAEAKYLLGEVFFVTGDHKQCYETLVALNTDFASYTMWVGKSFLLLSDNFAAIGDIFQAKATLNSLIDGDFPLQDIRDEARKKLFEIEQKNANKKKLTPQDSLLQPHD